MKCTSETLPEDLNEPKSPRRPSEFYLKLILLICIL